MLFCVRRVNLHELGGFNGISKKCKTTSKSHVSLRMREKTNSAFLSTFGVQFCG